LPLNPGSLACTDGTASRQKIAGIKTRVNRLIYFRGSLISLLDFKAFEDQVGGIHGLEVQRITFWADIRQVVCLELVSAFRAAHKRRNLRQLQCGAFDEGTLLFNDFKTELHVLGAVAGKRVEADFDELDTLGALRGSLFFNRVNDGADEMDFVHKMSFKSATASCAGQCAKAEHRLVEHGSFWWGERLSRRSSAKADPREPD
jgi:hypothetical protein